MMPDDGRPDAAIFVPRTPSWDHHDAWKRLRATPKHDIMQRDVLVFLRARRVAGLPERALVDRVVEGEYALVRRGNIIGYADAIEIIDINLRREVNVFEIKPVIDTVYGIVRQIKHTIHLTQETMPKATIFGHVIVPAEDPLLAEMRAEWPRTWAWGIKFEMETGGVD